MKSKKNSNGNVVTFTYIIKMFDACHNCQNKVICVHLLFLVSSIELFNVRTLSRTLAQGWGGGYF